MSAKTFMYVILLLGYLGTPVLRANDGPSDGQLDPNMAAEPIQMQLRR